MNKKTNQEKFLDLTKESSLTSLAGIAGIAGIAGLAYYNKNNCEENKKSTNITITSKANFTGLSPELFLRFTVDIKKSYRSYFYPGTKLFMELNSGVNAGIYDLGIIQYNNNKIVPNLDDDTVSLEFTISKNPEFWSNELSCAVYDNRDNIKFYINNNVLAEQKIVIDFPSLFEALIYDEGISYLTIKSKNNLSGLKLKLSYNGIKLDGSTNSVTNEYVTIDNYIIKKGNYYYHNIIDRPIEQLIKASEILTDGNVYDANDNIVNISTIDFINNDLSLNISPVPINGSSINGNPINNGYSINGNLLDYNIRPSIVKYKNNSYYILALHEVSEYYKIKYDIQGYSYYESFETDFNSFEACDSNKNKLEIIGFNKNLDIMIIKTHKNLHNCKEVTKLSNKKVLNFSQNENNFKLEEKNNYFHIYNGSFTNGASSEIMYDNNCVYSMFLGLSYVPNPEEIDDYNAGLLTLSGYYNFKSSELINGLVYATNLYNAFNLIVCNKNMLQTLNYINFNNDNNITTKSDEWYIYTTSVINYFLKNNNNDNQKLLLNFKYNPPTSGIMLTTQEVLNTLSSVDGYEFANFYNFENTNYDKFVGCWFKDGATCIDVESDIKAQELIAEGKCILSSEEINNIQGKIAIISRGAINFQTKIRAATVLGAKAVIIVNTNDAIIPEGGFMVYNGEVEINGNKVVIPVFLSGINTGKLISDSSSTNNFIIPQQIQDSYNKINSEAEKIKIPGSIYWSKNDDGNIPASNIPFIIKNASKINLREINTVNYVLYTTDTSNELKLELQAYDQRNLKYIGTPFTLDVTKEYLNEIKDLFPFDYGLQKNKTSNKNKNKNKIIN
jgi:hypothetical protein